MHSSGWSRHDIIDEAALRWLDDNRLRNGERWNIIFPEAESLGLNDAVTCAELVSKHLGVELFGRMLDDELNVNRLCAAFKSHGLNVTKFIESYNNGRLDRRFFGPTAAIRIRKEPARDVSGYTERDRQEMLAVYNLDRERETEFAGLLVHDEDLAVERECSARWPAAEQLEAEGVDIVVLDNIRREIGTEALAGLYSRGVDLEKLTVRVRRGVDAIGLADAINGGRLDVRVFNSARFPTGRFVTRHCQVLKLDGRDFSSNIDVSGLLGHPAGFDERNVQ